MRLRNGVLGLNYFGTLRRRVGYAPDRTLFYAMGGFAYGGITNTAVLIPPSVNPWTYSVSTDAVGCALGGGIELRRKSESDGLGTNI